MACVKYLKWLFIPVFAILLMSHNTFAIQPVFNMNDYSIVNSASSLRLNCIINNAANSTVKIVTDDWVCNYTPSSSDIARLRRFYSSEQWSFEAGDIVEFSVIVWSSVNLASLDGFFINFIGDNGAGLFLVNLEQVADNVFSNDSFSITNGTGGTQYNGSAFYSIYRFTFKAKNDVTTSIGYPVGAQDYFVWVGGNLSFRMYDIKQYRLSSEDNPEAVATQDAADNSSSAGSSSSSDATTATSSLISVIGGFVNVLTSAQPTNCKINANLNHIDIGQLDLCANPVPSYIQIIGSIILICAAIPLAIVLFNRFIGLFRSFQG